MNLREHPSVLAHRQVGPRREFQPARDRTSRRDIRFFLRLPLSLSDGKWSLKAKVVMQLMFHPVAIKSLTTIGINPHPFFPHVMKPLTHCFLWPAAWQTGISSPINVICLFTSRKSLLRLKKNNNNIMALFRNQAEKNFWKKKIKACSRKRALKCD